MLPEGLSPRKLLKLPTRPSRPVAENRKHSPERRDCSLGAPDRASPAPQEFRQAVDARLNPNQNHCSRRVQARGRSGKNLEPWELAGARSYPKCPTHQKYGPDTLFSSSVRQRARLSSGIIVQDPPFETFPWAGCSATLVCHQCLFSPSEKAHGVSSEGSV